MLNPTIETRTKNLEDFDRNINPYPDLIKSSQSSTTPTPIWGKALTEQKDKWQTHFIKEQPIVLEIGCHKGLTICQMAKDLPQHNFIGFDITFKRVYKTFERAAEARLSNVLSCLADGKYLDHFMADQELHGIVTFFPDPWIKKKSQKKNRLISENFCQLLVKKIKDRGFYWLKTDSRDYFEEVCQFMENMPFRKGTLADTYFEKNYSSSYEDKFTKSQTPFFSQVWVKTSELK